MQPRKSTRKTPPITIQEKHVSPDIAVAASKEPAAAPRKRTTKTSAGNPALPATKPRTSPTTKHRSAKPATVSPRPSALAVAAAGVSRHDPESSAPVTRGRIAELAYSYWLARGCQGGNDREDWFRAEREIGSRLG
jgi:hypothetical protein